MRNFLKKLLTTLLAISILSLFTGGYYLYTEINSLKSMLESVGGDTIIEFPKTEKVIRESVTQSARCDEECVEEIDKAVAEAIKALPTLVPTTSTSTTITSKTQQTSYVPFGSTSSSTSTDWYTLTDAGAFIDLKNDFSEDAYVTFEASLKVAHGNGQAFVRLWDDTNKIAVNGSELSTSNNSDYSLVKSGKLYLWNGNNSYKVQLKSLNGFEVFYTNGKVKVVY